MTAGPGRYAATDVHYPAAGGAQAALLVVSDAEFRDVVAEHVAHLPEVAPYQPGNFFRRELPAVRTVLGRTAGIELLVIDGYVDLDPDGRPGLGAYLRREFDLAVVGVAKTRFRSATHAVAVHRGTAALRPLYVTAAGIELARAAELVRRMAGPHRIPDSLRRVDRLARAGRHGGGGRSSPP